MPKLYEDTDGTTFGPGRHLLFECPGCGCLHRFTVEQPGDPKPSPCWTWNGDWERPTFSPSLLYPGGPHPRCHSFVRAGRIQFLSDSTHALAGQTVAMLEWE